MASVDDLLVPRGTRLVHIGPPKTGTTAIQRALHARRDELLRHGVVFPGRGTRPRTAGWAVIEPENLPRGRMRPTMEHWYALVNEVEEAGDRRVVISNESFADGYADAVRTIVDGLGGDRIHIVHTVRRVDKLLTSHWQQRVRAGLTLPYDEWLAIVLGEPDPSNRHWRGFWRHHDLAEVLDRWTSAAGADKVTLIVADESDHSLLPRLFERFLGLPERCLLLDAEPANRSMSLNETEMVRRLQQRGAESGWSDALFRQVLRLGVLDEVMATPRHPGDRPIELPAWAQKRASEINDERIETVRSLGVRVIGDPERLRTAPADGTTAVPDDVRVSAEVAARATAAAIAAGERRLTSARRQATADHVKAERAAAQVAQGELASLRRRVTSMRNVDDMTARELAAELRIRVARRLRGRRKRSRRANQPGSRK